MAHVYMGPLGSTQQVQGASGGGALHTVFAQNANLIAIPGDSLPHEVIPPTALIVPAGITDICVDAAAALECLIASPLVGHWTFELNLDGVPGSLVVLVGSSFAPAAAPESRTGVASGAFCGFIPPGPHTISASITSDIDAQCGGIVLTGSVFQMFRAFWVS
jgi:hypothetical protein